ncbi:MAG TPA: imidazole glycerol phosphate synthase subunit HisH [Armatimonadota bacterium]|jgi:glutamine amidotransferase
MSQIDIAIIDYGMGNLRSVQKAFAKVGFEADITSDAHRASRAKRLVLPGDGAFGACIENLLGLRSSGLAMADVITGWIAEGRPFLGICVGMQLLLETSEEMGEHKGLGIIPGRVRRFSDTDGLKVPQLGWNNLVQQRPSPLFVDVDPESMVYFMHSYYCDPEDQGVTSATTDYGLEFCSSLWRGPLVATQFHPEKSGATGLMMLRNFAERVA